ncbi:MAG: [Peptococcaceae bacterium]|nr:[FeFe] hydrogenase H-cluster maturation GTPase HydF [Peptococcaceae bacterium]
MSLNNTPQGERLHIALFGKRNAGKSSLINALTDQNLAIVSDVKGTTTDPVYKAMELLPLGPIMLIDTPGLDDSGELGLQRIKKAKEVLQKTDIALIVIDAAFGFSDLEAELINDIQARKIPFIVVYNKIDLLNDTPSPLPANLSAPLLLVSAEKKEGIEELKAALATFQTQEDEVYLVKDLLAPEDMVVLVIPIDSSAPKGRLILPQQQMIRDILDAGAFTTVTRENELPAALAALSQKPKMVITDSQAFAQAAQATPLDIPLTSFSILMARYKGDLPTLVRGAAFIHQLKDGDKILIAEGCTHHRQCEDIGTVKIPRMLQKATGKQLIFETSSGRSFPDNLEEFALVIHCGGCTLNRREMLHRLNHVQQHNLPVVNYGVLMAYLQGILPRTISLFPEALQALSE